MRRPGGARELTTYPSGAYRWALLCLTVLATVLAAFSLQLAPILPLLLPYLGFGHVAYGYFVTFSLLVSAAGAYFGGPLADRYGRVGLLLSCTGAQIVLLFLNVLITNIPVFIAVRTAMSIVSGLMAGAGAALVRDMSPRLNRGLAFGLFTVGQVGSALLVNVIAVLTLPMFGTWQSQIWIMGALASALYVPILMWLRDLSPELRHQIIASEIAALDAAGRLPKASELPASNRAAFAALLRHPHILLMVVGVNAGLTLIFTMTAFGPLMFTEAFGYTPAEAAEMNAYFWLANGACLVLAGWVSDRLQVRRALAIGGGVIALAVMALWLAGFSNGLDRATMAAIATALGCFYAFSYVPWAAQFSETLEDISPALQATGWALFTVVLRAWVAILAPLSLWVAVNWGWGAWIQVAFGGMVLYVASLATVRVHVSPAPARAAGGSGGGGA
jgi:OPA family glycerol-3-phosphate transporter-like MFS transporter